MQVPKSWACKELTWYCQISQVQCSVSVTSSATRKFLFFSWCKKQECHFKTSINFKPQKEHLKTLPRSSRDVPPIPVAPTPFPACQIKRPFVWFTPSFAKNQLKLVFKDLSYALSWSPQEQRRCQCLQESGCVLSLKHEQRNQSCSLGSTDKRPLDVSLKAIASTCRHEGKQCEGTHSPCWRPSKKCHKKSFLDGTETGSGDVKWNATHPTPGNSRNQASKDISYHIVKVLNKRKRIGLRLRLWFISDYCPECFYGIACGHHCKSKDNRKDNQCWGANVSFIWTWSCLWQNPTSFWRLLTGCQNSQFLFCQTWWCWTSDGWCKAAIVCRLDVILRLLRFWKETKQ